MKHVLNLVYFIINIIYPLFETILTKKKFEM